MTELIDWVEDQAQENLKFRLSCLETLLKECNTTLTILLTGTGALIAYIFKQIDAATCKEWLLFSAISLCIYFLSLSVVLVFKCMKIDIIQVPTNEPDNLYQKQFTLLQIREVELKNIQARINAAACRNLKIATALNKIRLLTLGAPAIFIL